MKASEMERLLANWDDDTDIYIETEDGLLHEFKFTERQHLMDLTPHMKPESILL